MANFTLRLLFIVWLALCGIIGFCLYRSPIDSLVSVLIGLSAAGLLLSAYSDRFFFLLFGLVVCLVPWLGRGGLLMVLSFMLVGMLCRLNGVILLAKLKKQQIEAAAEHRSVDAAIFGLCLILALGLFISAMPSLYADIDRSILSSIVQTSGLFGLRTHLVTNSGPGFLSLFAIAQFSVFVGVILAVRDGFNPRSERALISGLAIGGLVAGLIGFLQVLDVHEALSFSRGPFWTMVGRYGATFSDPNAFGVMSFFLIPLLVAAAYHLPERKPLRIGSLLAAVVLLNVSVWSGSRTLFVGLGFWLVVFLVVITVQRFPRAGKWFVLLFAVLVGVGVAVLATPSLNQQVVESLGNTPSIERVVKSFNPSHAEKLLYPRILFAQLAIELWSQHPFLGVGLGEFRVDLPLAAKALGIELGPWRDNANNYYLQVLAEQGALGLLLTITVLLGLAQCVRFCREVERGEASEWYTTLSVISLGIFLLLLWTGPHIEFTEVFAICGLSLGLGIVRFPQQATYPDDSPVLGRVVVFSCALLIVALMAAQWRERTPPVMRGLYAIENSETGAFRWTAREARFVICPKTEDASLTYQLQHPDIEQRPVEVSFRFRSKESELLPSVVVVADREEKHLVLPETQGPLLVTLSVSRAWSPYAVGLNEDRRGLGLLLKWQETLACRQLQ